MHSLIKKNKFYCFVVALVHDLVCMSSSWSNMVCHANPFYLLNPHLLGISAKPMFSHPPIRYINVGSSMPSYSRQDYIHVLPEIRKSYSPTIFRTVARNSRFSSRVVGLSFLSPRTLPPLETTEWLVLKRLLHLTPDCFPCHTLWRRSGDVRLAGGRRQCGGCENDGCDKKKYALCTAACMSPPSRLIPGT